MKWLKPAFNYTANFRWSDDLTREGQNISTQLRFGSNFTLTPAQLIEFIIKPKSAKKSRSSGRTGNSISRTRNRKAPTVDTRNQKKDSKKAPQPPEEREAYNRKAIAMEGSQRSELNKRNSRTAKRKRKKGKRDRRRRRGGKNGLQ